MQSNLSRAVEFFERVLGMPAAKKRSDYAKFELDSPPLVFSLEPGNPAERGSFNHAGFRFADSAALVEAQRRLESAGIATQREEGVECCYSRQTKFWVHDLDQRLWEFYVLEGDLEHRGTGQSQEQVASTSVPLGVLPESETTTWSHRMGSPFEFPVTAVDEIRMQGSFNLPVTDDEIVARLQQAFESLKPEGRIQLHMLTCEEPLEGTVKLSGPAAHVRHVPVRSALMRALEAAGFVDLQLTTFRSGACFEFEGQPLRETRIVARRAADVCSDRQHTVVFKGPFRSVVDDEGHEWFRGEPLMICGARWDSLKQTAAGELFMELPEAAIVSSCGT